MSRDSCTHCVRTVAERIKRMRLADIGRAVGKLKLTNSAAKRGSRG